MTPAPVRHLAAGFFLLAAALLAACRATPATVFYTLSPITPTEGRAPNAEGPLVGVGPVTLPELLDRPQIVTRSSAHRVELSEFHRWGGSLKDALPRVLARGIAAHLGSDRVAVYPWRDPVRPDYRVSVDVLQFDGRPGEAVDLVAVWKISQPADDGVRLVRRAAFHAPVEGAGIDALVAAHSRAVDDLAKSIAAAIAALEKGGA